MTKQFNNGYAIISRAKKTHYFNPNDQEITKEQFDNIKKIDPEMKHGYEILSLRSLAYITKDKKNNAITQRC